MVKKSLVLFLVLSFVAAMALGTNANVCLADDSGSSSGGDPGHIEPSCEPVTPTPFILDLFWSAVDAIAGCIAGVL
jgi:hypothetical protein